MMNIIHNYNDILRIEIPLKEDILKQDLNSYNTLDTEVLIKELLNSMCKELIDEYINSLKN